MKSSPGFSPLALRFPWAAGISPPPLAGIVYEWLCIGLPSAGTSLSPDPGHGVSVCSIPGARREEEKEEEGAPERHKGLPLCPRSVQEEAEQQLSTAKQDMPKKAK